jgi:hypothetical protein
LDSVDVSHGKQSGTEREIVVPCAEKLFGTTGGQDFSPVVDPCTKKQHTAPIVDTRIVYYLRQISRVGA